MCIQVSPIHPGNVKVMVHDLCLAFQAPATATVHVSNILEVSVRVVDKVRFHPLQPFAVVCLDTASAGWSLLSGPRIPEMPQRFLSGANDCFCWSILLPCFCDGPIWICIIRFVLPVNQGDCFISDPCHSSYRWRSGNLSGLTSECWIQIRNRSQPATLNTWILNWRQLLLYSLWRK